MESLTNPNNPPKSAGFISVVRAEEWWVEQARKNIAMYMTYISDGQRRPADHHLIWLRHIFDPKVKRLLIIAPRESAKTSVAVDVMSYWIGKFPELTNIIASVSFDQSRDRLDAVKQVIELPRYQNVFPHIHIDNNRRGTQSEFSVWAEKWRDGDKLLTYQAYRSLIASYGSLKNPTLHAAGIMGSTLIGRRFSGIALVDDPHDSKNSATAEQCDKVRKVFGETILGGVQHTGKIIVITTRWSEVDLAAQLMMDKNADGTPVWTVIDIPTIDAQGNSYWPQYWPVEKLEAKRAEVGEVMFQTMYMNNPIGASTGMFQPHHLINEIPEDAEFERIIISCDMARTKTAHADYTVMMCIAKDKNKPFRYFLLDARRMKVDYHEGVKEIAKFADEVWNKYGQLNAIVFEEPFDQFSATELREQRPDLPVTLVKPKGDKAQRLGNVAVKAQSGKLYINQSITCLPAIKSELLGFPKAAHDDCCDCLSLPLQLPMWSTSYQAGLVQVRSPFLL